MDKIKLDVSTFLKLLSSSSACTLTASYLMQMGLLLCATGNLTLIAYKIFSVIIFLYSVAIDSPQVKTYSTF